MSEASAEAMSEPKPCESRREFYVVELEVFDTDCVDGGAFALAEWEEFAKTFSRRSGAPAEGGVRVVDVERVEGDVIP